MAKLHRLSTGGFGPHPDLKEAAVAIRYKKYGAVNKCPTCGHHGSLFTSTDNCMMCARYKIELLKEALSDYPMWPEHIPRCDSWLDEVRHLAPLVNSGEWVIHGSPCTNHGHVRICSIDGTCECYDCSVMGTLKEEAVKKGDEWYVSTNTCSGCDTVTMRHVDDNHCKECGYMPHSGGRKLSVKKEGPDGRETPDSILMRDCPDLVISRADAEAFGYKVYRTGKACKHGHTGFSYVKTYNCIPCLRGK